MIKYKKTTNTNSRSVVAMISKQSRSKGKQQGSFYKEKKIKISLPQSMCAVCTSICSNGVVLCPLHLLYSIIKVMNINVHQCLSKRILNIKESLVNV